MFRKITNLISDIMHFEADANAGREMNILRHPNKRFSTMMILIFIIINFICSPVLSQQILFKNYTASDGLCSNTVWAINQDNQGFMWFGTKGGLNRFDGYEFRKFQHDNTDSTSLGNNFVRVIRKVSPDKIWIGTEKGVFIFDIRTEKFTNFNEGITSRINDILKDNEGNIWIATNNQGLYLYNKKADLLENYGHFMPGSDVRALELDNHGRIWIGTYGNGINVFNPKTSTFHQHRAGPSPGKLTSDVILTLYKSQEGVIWIGTLTGGLNYWDDEKKEFVHYLHRPDRNSLSDNIVRAINQRKGGELLIGTEKGLNIFDIHKQEFSAYKTSSSDPLSISDNAVWSIYVDKQKNVWIGTYFGGVNYVNMKGGKFYYYYPTQSQYSFNGKAVSSFLQDGGGIWVGTEDGGLNYYDPATQRFFRFPFRPFQKTLSYHNIHSLLKNDDGKLWIGTFTGGLNIYDPATGNVKNYDHITGDNLSLSNNSIYSIYKDSDKNIWIGTVEGLNIYDDIKDKFQLVDEQELASSVVYQVLEDEKGNLWVATYGRGVFKKEHSTQRWLQYTGNSTKNSLSGDRVISLFEDSKKRLWLGTDGGGLNLYQKNGSFIRFDAENDFPLKTIYSILEDGYGNLWMSSNQGILCFNPDTGKKIAFKEWDHLQSNQFNYGAGMKSDDGTIYFGGINGFNTFQPDSILKYYNDNQYAIFFTNFQLYNKDVPINGDNGFLPQAINYTRKIVLPHDQSVISFEFAGIEYISPKAFEYSFKMEGFDYKWNDVGQQRKATYTNLPPGEFIFKVKASHTKGAQSEKTSEIFLTILPPFYLTKVAYLIYAFMLVIAFILIRRNLIHRAERRNKTQLEKMKRKEEQLFYKRKIEFFTEMAHEIRTPLSLIIAPLEKLINSNKQNAKTREQLEIMAKNSDRLLSLTNHLLDFRRIESDTYIIKPEPVELVNLVRNMYSRFLGISNQRKIKFLFSTDIDQLNVEVDTEAMTKILSNLLINAFKFARKSVLIEISKVTGEAGGNYFTVSVTDDGIGIPKKDIDHIFDKFFKVRSGDHQYNNLGGAGIGLALAKSLAEMHHGKLQVESDESSFTKFMVKIPYNSVTDRNNIPKISAPFSEQEVHGGSAPKLLIVEDNKALLDFLCSSFKENDFSIYRSFNGNGAVKILKEKDIDIVLTDVMMPGMDGLTLCGHIKSNINLSQIPVVLLTAKSDPETEMEGLEIGADAYIHKPFKFKHVLLVINNLLKSRQMLKLKFSQQPLSDANSITFNSRDEQFIENIVELIEENMSNNNFTTELLSEEVGMSRSGLHKKLKDIAGVGPNEFIRLIRLKHAARLLQQGNYNISEVGYMSGFSSPSYFSKCFHEQFKKTPKEFISQIVTLS